MPSINILLPYPQAITVMVAVIAIVNIIMSYIITILIVLIGYIIDIIITANN